MTAREMAVMKLELAITLRIANRADVHKLEWYGQFAHFRNLLRRAYQEQMLGRRLMLVADLNGYPIGQVFIQLVSTNVFIADGESRGYLYSFRVMEMFRQQGIGTRLLLEAENILRERGFQTAMLSVAKTNHGALRLYQRNGYLVIGEDPGRWSYIDHRGVTRMVDEPSWMLEKQLV
jgi:ribosomal protein S18 acetylase RimI-like enzyme